MRFDQWRARQRRNNAEPARRTQGDLRAPALKRIKGKPFLPNGCGAGPTGAIVPDGIGAVEFKTCCDIHDLAYHIGGNPLTDKLKADAGLSWCIMKRWWQSAREPVPVYRKALRAAGAVTLGPLYFTAVTLLGWTPLTWKYRRSPVPPEEELRKLEGVSHEELVAAAAKHRQYLERASRPGS